MTSQLLTVLLGALCAVATVCGVAYVFVRVRTLNAYRAFIEADGEPGKAAREVYFSLDKRQKRLAIAVLSLYALTFIGLTPFLQPLSGFALGCVVLITLSLLSVGLTATICNEKESTARMHADSNRRIRRFQAPLAPTPKSDFVYPTADNGLPTPQSETCVPGRPHPLAGNPGGLPNTGFVDTSRKTTCFAPHVQDVFEKGGSPEAAAAPDSAETARHGGWTPDTGVAVLPPSGGVAVLESETETKPLIPRRSVAVAAAETAPFSLVMIGDFGKDMDDEDTLVLSDGVNLHQVVSTHGSRKQELFEMLAVIANLAPAEQRGRLAKGTLRLLGRPDVPVGVGTDCGLRADGHEKEFEGVAYLADASDLEPGADLLVRSLESADDGSVILLLISGLTDAAALLRDHEDLVHTKVALVAIMGGVEQKDDEVLKDADGYMIPDSAANNKFDMESAKFVYHRLQELCVPMTILTREAAYAAPVPRDLYDRMAATGHPVGVKLQRTQRHAIQDVWVRANLAADDPRRNKLPERCNKEWFCNTFCAGQGLDRNGDDDIWDLIQSFQLYDPMTLIAAVPELTARFFDPTIVTVNGVDHNVIGVSKSKNGVKDPAALSSFMIECFITSLVANTTATRDGDGA